MKLWDTKKRTIVWQASLATLVTAAAIFLSSGPASAYVACNRAGDCWHTDTRVHFPHVRLAFHSDKWWDRRRTDARYHWHDPDNDHDWHHGYWEGGTWHKV